MVESNKEVQNQTTPIEQKKITQGTNVIKEEPKSPLDNFLDTHDFTPQEKIEIKQLQEKGIIPSLEELKKGLINGETIKNDLKERIEKRNNPKTIEDFFNKIEDGFNRTLVAVELINLKDYQQVEGDTKILKIKKINNSTEEDILNKLNIDPLNLNTTKLIQAIKNKRIIENLQPSQEAIQKLDTKQQETRKKLLDYFKNQNKELTPLQEKLSTDKDVLDAVHTFLIKDIFKKGIIIENGEEINTNYDEEEKLEFIVSPFYEETLVHVLNKRINQGKDIEEKDKINWRYISSNMEYRIKAYSRKKDIDWMEENSEEKKDLKEQAKERFKITLNFLRTKSNIVSNNKFNSASDIEKRKIIQEQLKTILEQEVEDESSKFYGTKYRDILGDMRVVEFLDRSIIQNLIKTYKSPNNKNPMKNEDIWHDITSYQMYAFLSQYAAADNKTEVNIDELFQTKNEDLINIMIWKLNNELWNKIRNSWQKNKQKFEHYCKKTGFGNHEHLQQRGERFKNIKDYKTQREQLENKESLSIQEQVKSNTIGKLKGRDVLAANPKIQEFLKQNKNSEFSKKLNEKIKNKMEGERQHPNFFLEHIKGDLLEKGINPEKVFKNESIQPDLLLQAFIEQGFELKDAQEETEHLLIHLKQLQEKNKTPRENREKRIKVREENIEAAEKMVKLEALGVVFDTIGIYLKASPKTENFKLENINNIEIKDWSLIITGEINGVSISFGYNLDSGLLSTNRTISHQDETYKMNVKEPNYPLFHLKNFSELQDTGFEIMGKKMDEMQENIRQRKINQQSWNHTDKSIFREKAEKEEEKIKQAFWEKHNLQVLNYQQENIEDNIEKNKTMSYFTEIVQSEQLKKLEEYNIKTTPEMYEMLKNIDNSINSSQDATLLKNTFQRILDFTNYQEKGLHIGSDGKLTDEQQKNPAYQSEVFRQLFTKEKIEADQNQLSNPWYRNNSIFLLIDHFTDKSKPNEPKIKLNEMVNYISKMERGELEADKELLKTPSELTKIIIESQDKKEVSKIENEKLPQAYAIPGEIRRGIPTIQNALA